MPTFHPDHLDAFTSIAFTPQPPYGKAPAAWATMMKLQDGGGLAVSQLPTWVLTRDEVREHCRAPFEVIHGYVVTMAWGDQGAGRGGTRHALSAWSARATVEQLLKEVRKGHQSPAEAYDMFAATPVAGLGPAYFTKLLYFFRAGDKHGQPVERFIMDQWTAKSVNLLTGREVVRIAHGGTVALNNTGRHFQAFCDVVGELRDELVRRTGRPHTGEEVEQMLFSLGSIKKQPEWPWRSYVKKHWEPVRKA